MSMTNQYKLAHQNDVRGEQDAEQLLGLKAATNKLLDVLVKDRAIKIKSCETVVKDNSYEKGWRWGRFGFSGPQHAELLKKDGMYLFLLYDEDHHLIHVRLISASLIDARCNINSTGVTMIGWPTILARIHRLPMMWRGSETVLLKVSGYGRLSVE